MRPFAKVNQQIVFYSGPSSGNRVALTFDDGPDMCFTPQMLEILKQEQVSATFFVVGKMVEQYPHVVEQIVTEGHVVGNHSYSHPYFTQLTLAEVQEEIDRANALLNHIIHHKPLFVRPPYGAIDDRITQSLGDRGYKVIQWSVDTLDWREDSTPESILERVKADIRAGGIVLQHSFGRGQIQHSVAVLPQIIQYLKDSGYRLVTVDQLLQLPAYV